MKCWQQDINFMSGRRISGQETEAVMQEVFKRAVSSLVQIFIHGPLHSGNGRQGFMSKLELDS